MLTFKTLAIQATKALSDRNAALLFDDRLDGGPRRVRADAETELIDPSFSVYGIGERHVAPIAEIAIPNCRFVVFAHPSTEGAALNTNALGFSADNAVQPAKRPMAFFVAITPNLAFAAGNVALSLNRHMQGETFDIIVYYTKLSDSDRRAFERIANVRLVNFTLSDEFVSSMLARMPMESRFRDANRLMCFAHFEAFELLKQYQCVAWLDVDTSIQRNIMGLKQFRPFGITPDRGWTVQNNFSRPIEKYAMDAPGYCTAVMVVHDSLPFERLHRWCYEKALEYADCLVNPDQAIINIALQEFGIVPAVASEVEWQCISWHEKANVANIAHFGWTNKVWNTTNVCNAFPEWYRTHLEWLELGGSDFDQSAIAPRNVLPELNDTGKLKDELSIAKRQAASLTAALNSRTSLPQPRIKEHSRFYTATHAPVHVVRNVLRFLRGHR